MKSFDFVEKNNLCAGCAACVYSIGKEKIEMKVSEDGYLRPQLNSPLSADEDNLFSNVCPSYQIAHKEKSANWSEIWGPVIGSYMGWSNDAEIRHSASSGGGITSLSLFLLDSGIVDGVLHVGISEDSPIKNVWKISRSREDLIKNCGSRYAPAAPLEGIKYAMETSRKIALIGKPCDIAAARKLADLHPEIKNSISIYISFMCAGVPSFDGTHAVIKKLGFEVKNIESFRYRGNGWPGYATAIDKNGASNSMSYNDSWGKVLNKHLQLRCKICSDGTGEFADITFADGWHGDESGYPRFDEEDGRSLILSRTEVGRLYLENAVSKGYISIENFNSNDIEKIQPYQAIRKKLLFSRILAMKIFGIKHPRYDYGNIVPLALSAGIKNNMVSFAGMLKRAKALRKKK